MSKKVFIRTDANFKMGYGHIMRCYAIAMMIKDHYSIDFFSIDIPKNIKQDLINEGFVVNVINCDSDFYKLLDKNTIVISDGYSFNEDYQINIARKKAKHVFIDDLHNQKFITDIVINHAPNIDKNHYNISENTKLALGLDYALLRPKFLESAKKSKAKSKSDSVFICFGGADPDNLLEKTLQIVLEFDSFKQIFVVGTNVQKLDIRDNRLNLFSSLNEAEMVEIISKSDIAIVPSSTLLFEVLALRCKTVSGYFVDNQRKIFDGFNKLKAIFPCNFYDKKSMIEAINHCKNSQALTHKVIDGKSHERIVQIFKEL
jgi:UDP-2,4-diacetamido-2,4,6-trideoxy-beta-L-altropyranose hydrolase